MSKTVSVVVPVAKLSDAGRRNLEFNVLRMIATDFKEVIVVQQAFSDSPALELDPDIIHIIVRHERKMNLSQLINLGSKWIRATYMLISDYNLYYNYRETLVSIRQSDVVVKPARFFFNLDNETTDNLLETKRIDVLNHERAYYDTLEDGACIIKKELFDYWGGMDEQEDRLAFTDSVHHMIGGRIRHLDKIRGAYLFNEDDKANSYQVLRASVVQPDWAAEMDESVQHKINYSQQWKTKLHRSGWAYAIDSLRWLHNVNGAELDGFIEKKFAWEPQNPKITRHVPHLKPWVGFIHVPQDIPDWFQSYQSPEHIFQTELWKRSVKYCRGLFCLTKYHRKWLEENLSVPVSDLIHPTEIPDLQFSMDAFLGNKNKQIVQVGWWLRRLNGIYQLPTRTYEKVFLFNYMSWVIDLMKEERKRYNITIDPGSVRVQEFLSNQHYDLLLSRNLVFLYMYNCSASNAVIECIARNTPILVNPLPPIVEYLGKDYPFYFSSLEEAADKAEDMDCVYAAYQYLSGLTIKKKFTQEYFCKSFVNSKVYQGLPYKPEE